MNTVNMSKVFEKVHEDIVNEAIVEVGIDDEYIASVKELGSDVYKAFISLMHEFRSDCVFFIEAARKVHDLFIRGVPADKIGKAKFLLREFEVCFPRGAAHVRFAMLPRLDVYQDGFVRFDKLTLGVVNFVFEDEGEKVVSYCFKATGRACSSDSSYQEVVFSEKFKRESGFKRKTLYLQFPAEHLLDVHECDGSSVSSFRVDPELCVDGCVTTRRGWFAYERCPRRNMFWINNRHCHVI